ncbi:hypothetical protein J4456_01365 [Candidatus Pacearchaeota archaeon]|nr:hypothetical protein [Candidatus Pacearchaeota archaeon]
MLEQIPEMQLIFQEELVRFDHRLPHTDFHAFFLELRHKQSSIPYILAHTELSSPISLL